MDLLDFTRYLAALVLVLGLLAGFAWALRIAQARGLLPGMASAKTGKRMRVVESLMIDARRRVVIVQIDGAEHAVLLGASSELVLSGRPPFTPDTPETGAPQTGARRSQRGGDAQ